MYTLLRKVGIASWGEIGCKALMWVATSALFLMVFVGTADALGPQLFGVSFSGGFEWIRFLLILVVWFNLPLLQLRRAHIQVDIVTRRLPFKVSRWFDIITGSILMAIIYGVLTWGNFEIAQYSWSVKEYWEGRPAPPVYPVKMAIVLVLSLCLLIVIWQVTRFRQKQ